MNWYKVFRIAYYIEGSIYNGLYSRRVMTTSFFSLWVRSELDTGLNGSKVLKVRTYTYEDVPVPYYVVDKVREGVCLSFGGFTFEYSKGVLYRRTLDAREKVEGEEVVRGYMRLLSKEVGYEE